MPPKGLKGVEGKRGKSGSRSNSRRNSTSSPLTMSPSKVTDKDDRDETWECHNCMKIFSEPEAEILECQRCRDHYCIKCLNKSSAEYEILSKSDTMWFCVSCREKVEKNIITDRKIEDRCNEIMAMYELRVTKLENEMEQKCDEGKVREIMKEEITKLRADPTNIEIRGKQNTTDMENPQLMSTVLTEINERKRREVNIVVYGSKECKSQSTEERVKYDMDVVKKIFVVCEAKLEEGNIAKVIRLGRYTSDKADRPILVAFDKIERKQELFKNIHKLRESTVSELRISNDLTKTEREMDKKLYEEAKDKSQGEDTFKVRGPPWARKIVKV